MPKWGDFQSLLQLAIGLNATFAALSSFLGNHVQREQLLVEEYVKQAEFYEEKSDSENVFSDVETKEDVSALVDSAHKLRSDFQNLEVDYNNFIYGPIRFICIIFSLTSFLLLTASSYAYGSDISSFWQICSFIQFTPFLAGMTYAVYLSTYRLSKIRSRKNELFENIRLIEGKFRTWHLAVRASKLKPGGVT